MMTKPLGALFSGPWMTALGVLLYVVALVLGIAFGRLGHAEGTSLAGPVTWAMASLLWWGYYGPRLCSQAYGIASLRMPGAHLTLLRGIVLHMLLSIAPTLIGLLLWAPADQDVQLLAAALWLGSCYGLLTISLPSVLNFIPVILLTLYWPVLAHPGLCVLLGLLALSLTCGLWAWHLRRPRPKLLMPLGLVLDGYWVGLTKPMREHLSTPPDLLSKHDGKPDDLRQARMAAVLGHSCQTIRQVYGKRGQYLSYLVLGGFLGLVYWLKPSYSRIFISMWAAVLLVWIPLQPIGTLIDLHSHKRSTLAKLLLTPGLPPREQLEAALLRQLRTSMLERAVFLTLLIIAMGWNSESPGIHQPLQAIVFSTLMLTAGLGLVKLAWRGKLKRLQLGLGTIVAMLSMFVSSILLRNA
ncbi:MAG: hypothetical protein RSE94_16030 [Pseudomonas sp.]